MRAPSATAAACALVAALAGGCGGDSPPPAPVRVTISAPTDMQVVHDGSVEVSGTVEPAGATVTVDGRRTGVTGGGFSATVSLEPGTNVVDVIASAGDARPALIAFRVRRLVSVPVPDVTGLTGDDAKAVLRDRGLKASIDDTDSLFDRLLPGDPKACSTDPGAGAQVDPGTTVTVTVSKSC